MSTRFVLGMGGTVDYEIRWDPAVLEQLAAEHGIGAEDLDLTTPVESVRDLVRSLLAFVRDGVGGERFVASSDIVEAFAARFAKEVTLGGTCVRAAIAMDVLGVPSTMHLVSIDDNVRRLLPALRRLRVERRSQDTLDPHLIVQYPAGTRVRVGDVELVAPHPNRIIYANDPPHRELRIARRPAGRAAHGGRLPALVASTSIQDPATLESRLAQVRDAMRALPPDALVVFEDAGYHVPALSRRVRDEMVWSARRLQPQRGRDAGLPRAHGRPARRADASRRPCGSCTTVVPAPTLVVHTKYWALAVGQRATALRPALRRRDHDGEHPLLDGRRLHGRRLRRDGVP